ncbi:hypothetical protein SCG7086_CL_00100 [Chlamydiales bacterium SCGC AG-110-P3]|nr:hypothetical protein SCG7086_CL_00100 [Chlamydiales bacterium SCGC AG-110-P3]
MQAQASSIPRSNFHRRLASGEWVREQRGIYRLARYPVIDRPELVIYSLWSCFESNLLLAPSQDLKL